MTHSHSMTKPVEEWVEECREAGYEDLYLYIAHQTGLTRGTVKANMIAAMYGG